MSREITLNAINIHSRYAGGMSTIILLAGQCPDCRGISSKNGEYCETCDGTGTALSDNGRKILELLNPIIDAKIEVAKHELRLEMDKEIMELRHEINKLKDKID